MVYTLVNCSLPLSKATTEPSRDLGLIVKHLKRKVMILNMTEKEWEVLNSILSTDISFDTQSENEALENIRYKLNK